MLLPQCQRVANLLGGRFHLPRAPVDHAQAVQALERIGMMLAQVFASQRQGALLDYSGAVVAAQTFQSKGDGTQQAGPHPGLVGKLLVDGFQGRLEQVAIEQIQRQAGKVHARDKRLGVDDRIGVFGQ